MNQQCISPRQGQCIRLWLIQQCSFRATTLSCSESQVPAGLHLLPSRDSRLCSGDHDSPRHTLCCAQLSTTAEPCQVFDTPEEQRAPQVSRSFAALLQAVQMSGQGPKRAAVQAHCGRYSAVLCLTFSRAHGHLRQQCTTQSLQSHGLHAENLNSWRP